MCVSMLLQDSITQLCTSMIIGIIFEIISQSTRLLGKCLNGDHEWNQNIAFDSITSIIFDPKLVKLQLYLNIYR